MHALDSDYSLFDKELSTGKMINRLRNEGIFEKMENEVIGKDLFRVFVDGINVVYRFRNIMGAHSGFEWGMEQVATSCLILTFYLADLYVYAIRKDE